MGNLCDVPVPIWRQVQKVAFAYGATGNAIWGVPKLIRLLDEIEEHLSIDEHPNIRVVRRNPMTYRWDLGMEYERVPPRSDVYVRHWDELETLEKSKPHEDYMNTSYIRHVPIDFAKFFYDMVRLSRDWPTVKNDIEAWNKRIIEIQGPVDAQDVIDVATTPSALQLRVVDGLGGIALIRNLIGDAHIKSQTTQGNVVETVLDAHIKSQTTQGNVVETVLDYTTGWRPVEVPFEEAVIHVVVDKDDVRVEAVLKRRTQ